MLDTEGAGSAPWDQRLRVEGPQPQLGSCEEGRISFEGRSAPNGAGRSRYDLRRPGRNSAARPLDPAARRGPRPDHGRGARSEGSNALDFNAQRFAPASGVGVFVYAKRGSGGSEGHTQDFHILAEDAAAAVVEASSAGRRPGEPGRPARRQPGRLDSAGSPPAGRPSISSSSVLGLRPTALVRRRQRPGGSGSRGRGWGPGFWTRRGDHRCHRRIRRLHGAVGFSSEAVRARYRAEPWFADMKGEFTGLLLNAPTTRLSPAPQLETGRHGTMILCRC